MMTFIERYQYVLIGINLAYLKADMQEVEKWKSYRRELIEKEAPESIKDLLFEPWGVDSGNQFAKEFGRNGDG